MQDYQWLDELLEKQMPNMTAKKREIVKAALCLFSEKGYAATSTKEIAAMAGVSEGAIFKHFSSKRELMLSLIDVIIEEIMLTLFYTGLPELLEKEYENYEEFLTALARNRLSIITKGISIYKILIQEIPFHPEIREKLQKKVAQVPMAELFSHLSIRGLELQRPVGEVVITLATCFCGFVQTRYLIVPEFFNRMSPEEREKDMVEFIRFLVKGLELAEPSSVGGSK